LLSLAGIQNVATDTFLLFDDIIGNKLAPTNLIIDGGYGSVLLFFDAFSLFSHSPPPPPTLLYKTLKIVGIKL